MANRFFREFDKDKSTAPSKSRAGPKIAMPVAMKPDTAFNTKLPGTMQPDRSMGVKKLKIDAGRKGL